VTPFRTATPGIGASQTQLIFNLLAIGGTPKSRTMRPVQSRVDGPAFGTIDVRHDEQVR